MLGAQHVLGIDMDPSALVVAQSNLDEFDELPVRGVRWERQGLQCWWTVNMRGLTAMSPNSSGQSPGV